jgi:hypothetical protein
MPDLTLYISKEDLEKQGFFTNLSATVDHQGAVCGCDSDDNFYVCALCQRTIPNCFGADDDFFELCDDCASVQQDAKDLVIDPCAEGVRLFEMATKNKPPLNFDPQRFAPSTPCSCGSTSAAECEGWCGDFV